MLIPALLPRIPVGDWFANLVRWLKATLGIVFDAIVVVLDWIIDSLEWLLNFSDIYFEIPSFWFLSVLLALLAWKLAGRGVAIFTFLGILLIASMNLWGPAVQTLAVIITATIVALIIGIPLGILAAKFNPVNAAVRPVLDFMQTLPAFVYLLPAVIFFGIGVVPAVIATIIFAMPPAVRLTNLGIRQVPVELIEAGEAFGSNWFQLLFKVQLPQALPTIMAGVNQCIMLALSMVVIASLIGGGGLGSVVNRGISRLDVGLGFEGGLAVVIIAIILDRLTQGSED